MKVALTDDLDTCRALRRTVFIDEQGVTEAEEWDGLDDQALHVLGWLDGTPVGTARVFIEGDTGKIGRVCVLPEMRGLGLGAELIRAGIAHFRPMPGVTRARLGAQCHAMGFYAKLGFTPVGEISDDAGIPHQDMILPF